MLTKLTATFDATEIAPKEVKKALETLGITAKFAPTRKPADATASTEEA